MPWIDRIDFTDETRCARCHRPLRLGIAHIVVESDHFEYAYGPTCAKLAAPDSSVFPDFTKAAVYEESDIEGEESKPDSPPRQARRSRPPPLTAPQPDERVAQAMAYVRLRQSLMKDFVGVRYAPLEPLYEKIRHSELTPDDVDRIHRLMDAVERSRPLLSLKSLQTAYAYHRVLQRAAAAVPADKRVFLLSLDEQLCRFGRLTDHQIQGANRWLQNQGKIRLAPCEAWQTPATRSPTAPGAPAESGTAPEKVEPQRGPLNPVAPRINSPGQVPDSNPNNNEPT